ncbi:MAG: excinuclease ABC subunit UvrC [Clostridia bacterium]|nr:excinuclease ABC subunit UvrC [Clostridia bacterium]
MLKEWQGSLEESNRAIKKLREKAIALPEAPGVYIMKNKKNEIIYIGKAKSLKDRVSQYFGSQNNHSEKVRQMVSRVENFEYILTDSEFEALVLECSLIKQNKPKYNILLKDDKGYNYIKISKEKWPRITEAKQAINDGSEYIGPYTRSVKSAVNTALKIFKLPDCNLDFSRRRYNRACLNYYIKQCSAPCIGKISHGEYLESVREAVDFLKGGNKASVKQLSSKMEYAAERLDFEKAAKLRDKIELIKKLAKEEQKVILSKSKEQDVVALVKGKQISCFEVFKFLDGRLNDREEFLLKNIDIEDDENVRYEFLQRYYSSKTQIPKYILVDEYPEDKENLEKWLTEKKGKKVEIIKPQKGESLKIVEMCKNNAAEKIAQSISRTNRETYALESLAKILSLKNFPEYIESYDISNTAGSENVAGMVVFYNGRPLKSRYKKFKIKSFIGQDDYASMREVVERRIKEYKSAEKKDAGFAKLPDLILLDGGKGQVSAVEEILKKENVDIPVFGIVKDNKHKTRAITGHGEEIVINSNREVFSLISKIQEEVHRFAIGYHRTLRKKNSLTSELLAIPGVGTRRADALWRHFKTIERIKAADLDELMSVKGITKFTAESIHRFFRENGNQI